LIEEHLIKDVDNEIIMDEDRQLIETYLDQMIYIDQNADKIEESLESMLYADYNNE
jgi:hypothetical protein